MVSTGEAPKTFIPGFNLDDVSKITMEDISIFGILNKEKLLTPLIL